MTKDWKTVWLPLVLTATVLIADQATKWLIVTHIELNTIGYSFFGEFFRIIHVRNPGIAFSLGNSFSASARSLLFAVLPLIVLGGVLFFYFSTDDFTRLQRWALAGIVGGGLGNVADRFFRPDGVVDFLDFKFYGLFGLERWPTFNVADMTVVICGFLLIFSFAFTGVKKEK